MEESRTSGVVNVLADKEGGTPVTAQENTEVDKLHPNNMVSTATPTMTGPGLVMEETRMLAEEPGTPKSRKRKDL